MIKVEYNLRLIFKKNRKKGEEMLDVGNVGQPLR